MIKYPLNLSSTALLIIDMQNSLVDPDYPLVVPSAQESVQKINQLIWACRKQTVPVIWTTHEFKSDLADCGLMPYSSVTNMESLETLSKGSKGIEIFPEMEFNPDDLIIKKNRFSAFFNTDLEDRLKENNIDTLIVTGTILNVCCDSTIRDAFFRDIKVFLPIEGNTARDHPDLGFGSFKEEELAGAILTSLGNRFAHLVTTEEMVQMILDN